jgi:cytochrome b6-f complex iron-sulfur subunit
MINYAKIDSKLTKNCTRRQFVKQTVVGFGTVAIGTFAMQVLASCSTSNPAGPSGNNNDTTLTVDISLAENQALSVVGGTIALMSNDIDNAGLLLIRESQLKVRAFSRECTHNQCTVDAFANGKSVCPCHGSEYDTTGNVTKGPAPSRLKEYDTELLDNIVTIS